MVTNVPTFQSDRVSSIPSMGIVEQSGMRDLVGAMSETGKVWDVIGDYANQKADQFMQREMTLAAEEAVRSGGLNPADLSDPITAADQIYRQAALNTYSIQVESDIADNMNRIYLESQYNPNGFLKKAEAYTKGKIEGLAPELKNSVSKYALADIRKRTFSLQQELRNKILEENIKAENIALEKYSSEIINAESEDEKEIAIGKAAAVITNSAAYITDDLKLAKLSEFNKELALKENLKRLATSEVQPHEAFADLKEKGVAVDAYVMQQVFSVSGIEQAYYERKREEERARAAKQQTEFLNNQITQAYLDMESGVATEEELGQRREKIKSDLIELGASADKIVDFETNFNKMIYGSQNDSPEIVNRATQMIQDGNPAVFEFLENSANGLSTKKLLELQEQAKTNVSDIATSGSYKRFESGFLRNTYPHAFATQDRVEVLKSMSTPESLKELEMIREQKAIVDSIKNSVIKKVNDPENPVSLNEAIQSTRNMAEQTGAYDERVESYDIISDDDGVKNRVATLLNSDEPELRLYLPGAKGGGMLTVRKGDNDLDLIPDAYRAEIEQVIDKKITHQNARQAINLMIDSVKSFYEDENRIISTPPYSKEELKAISRHFNLNYDAIIEEVYGQ